MWYLFACQRNKYFSIQIARENWNCACYLIFLIQRESKPFLFGEWERYFQIQIVGELFFERNVLTFRSLVSGHLSTKVHILVSKIVFADVLP